MVAIIVMVSKICLFVLLSLSILSFDSFGQSYGLEFAGHEVVQDKRTGLHLGADSKLCMSNFQLKFDLTFLPGRKDYFGYIFRAIDEQKRNIDLVYDMRFEENRHFKLVIGDQITAINFDIPFEKLVRDWYQLTFSFDVKKQQLELLVDGKRYRQKIKLVKGCYDFFFGANNSDGLSIKDVPPMIIRNVVVGENGVDKYSWPLDERAGLKALDTKQGQHAVVANPIWIKKKHYNWELVNQFSVQGAASIAYNPSKEEIYVIGMDSMSVVSVLSHQLTNVAYQSGRLGVLPGNQSLFEPKSNQLFNLFIDQRLASTFNLSKRTWSEAYSSSPLVSDYIHANKFYSEVDSSIYLLGGYGQYTYRKMVFRYHLPDGKWSEVSATGTFTPRYLAALGKVSNGVYILGGYGSTTGEQILQPRNIYELNFYDVTRRTFKKVLTLTPKSEDFAFANSMIVDEKSAAYHALIFPNAKYKSTLQLISGSLTSPEYKLVGSQIPYEFHDVDSFADLFFSPKGNKYIAVTVLLNPVNRVSKVKIYTLLGPPESLTIPDETVPLKTLIAILISSAALGAAVYLVGFKLTRKKTNALNSEVISSSTGLATDTAVSATVIANEHPVNTIFLFGNFQLFDKQGEDVTKLFSPLMKELFLLILLYTVNRRGGISNEKLTEILWYDKSVESARNNRSVNVAKLRTVLERMDGCHIAIESGNWTMIFDNELVIVDYILYLQIMKTKRGLSTDNIEKLSTILTRGNFLSNIGYDWLDTYKSEISNQLVDALLQHATSTSFQHEPSVLIKLADQVLSLDGMNEEAVAIKCKAWVKMGKHTLATSVFENFKKEYKSLYGESFPITFREIIAEE